MPVRKKNSNLRNEVKARNYRNTEKAIALARWLVIVFAFLYVNAVKRGQWPVPLLDAVLLFASLYNLFIILRIRSAGPVSRGLTVFLMYCDMTAVSVGLFFTGGVQSPFFFLWYLTLFTAGARFGFLKSLVLQIPIAIIHIFLVYYAGRAGSMALLDKLIPGLFSIATVSLFGSIFSREEHYTLDLMEGFHRDSIVDRLTGLYNYACFMDELKKEQARADRTGTPFSLVIFDLDFFKKVNDSWGHEKGNLLLQGVADILKSNARMMDTVARYGGEEFVILMPDSADAEVELAERIRKKVEEAEFRIVPGPPVKITISAGVATYPRDASTVFELLDRADIGLYKAKNLGRNRVCCQEAAEIL